MGFLKFALCYAFMVCTVIAVALGSFLLLLRILSVIRTHETLFGYLYFVFVAVVVTYPFFFCVGLFVYRSEDRAFCRAIRDQHCTQCKYDLRGSIAAGRGECPECGCLIERLD